VWLFECEPFVVVARGKELDRDPPTRPFPCHDEPRPIPMTTLTITLPGPLQELLARKLADSGYASVSEYVQALLEAKRLEELEAWEGLRQKVEEGLASGPAIPATDEFWQSFRGELASHRLAR